MDLLGLKPLDRGVVHKSTQSFLHLGLPAKATVKSILKIPRSLVLFTTRPFQGLCLVPLRYQEVLKEI